MEPRLDTHTDIPRQHLRYKNDKVLVEELTGTSARIDVPSAPNVVLVYALSYRGRWRFTWGGSPRSALVTAGQMFLLNPGLATTWEFSSPHHCVFLHIPFEQLAAAMEDIGCPGIEPHFRLVQQAFDPTVGTLLRALLDETRQKEPGSQASFDALLRLLSIHLLRRYRADDCIEDRTYLAPARLQAALAFVEANLGKRISTTELSDAAELSPYHFARMFKLAVGQTPHQYVLARRIDQAKILLAKPRPLVDIALEVGFPNQSYFGTVFRKLTGLTPRQYRAQVSGSGMKRSSVADSLGAPLFRPASAAFAGSFVHGAH